MNQLDALKQMCHHFPGGREVIALRLGKSDEVLRKELAGDAKFKMGVVDAERIAAMCIEAGTEQRFAYASAVATSCGGFVQLPVVEMSDLPCLNKTIAEIIKEVSHVVTSVTESDEDGVISDNDLARDLKEINEARVALQKLEHALRAKNAAGKPAAMRAVA